MKEGLGVENKRLIESPSSFPIILPLNTIGPPCSRVPHSQIQPTIDQKYSEKKFQKVPKSKLEVATHQQQFT